MYTGIRLLLLICPFILHFFLSNFQTLKFFVTLVSETVRPRRLKLCTHLDSGWIYRVYQNRAAAAYLSLYFPFFFLSNFQTLKFFVTLFSMGGCIVYTRIRLLLLIHPIIFFHSNFQTLKFFVTLFSETVRPRRLRLGTHVDNGWLYRVYGNQAAALICPFIFHSLQFSNINIFVTFLRNCEA